MEFLPFPGTPLDEVDTPALIVDLPTLEANIETMHSFFQQRETKIRPHAKAHKCPDIARIQLAAGGTTGGVCTAKLGEAEAMVQGGIDQVFIANQIVTPLKIRRLMALAHHAHLMVAVDDPKNVEGLSEAAQAHGVAVDVVIEVNIRENRCGVEPGEAALELARQVEHAPGLRYAGLMGFEAVSGLPDFEERAIKTRERVQRLLDTREVVEQGGLPVEICSAGGTATWDITGTMSGITDVQLGAYIFMDLHYRYLSGFGISLKVLTTVISRPRKGLAVVDCGHKTIGLNYLASMSNNKEEGFTGLPEVEHPFGARVMSLSAEHGILEVDGDAESLRPGDKLILLPSYSGAPVNQNDFYLGVRSGRVEAIWEITGRGRTR